MELNENNVRKEDKHPIFECKDCRYLWGDCKQTQKECINCKSKNIISYKNIEDYKEKKKQEQKRKEEAKIDEIKKKFRKQYERLKKDIKKIDYKGLVLKENFYPNKLYFGFLEKDNIRYLAYLWSDGKKSYFEFSKGIMGIHYSLFNYFKNNKDYHKRLNRYKEELRKKTKKCAFCKKPFLENQVFHLHHKTDFRKKVLNENKKIEKKIMEGKLSVLDGYREHERINNEIIENYSHFKNSVLVCLGCHYSQHKELIEAIKAGVCGLPLFSIFSKQKNKRKI